MIPYRCVSCGNIQLMHVKPGNCDRDECESDHVEKCGPRQRVIIVLYQQQPEPKPKPEPPKGPELVRTVAPLSEMEVHHKDGNPKNNRTGNLEVRIKK